MSEPSREHVEAVANLLHDAEHIDPECDCGAKGSGGPWGVDAEVILTSTDPAVLDAMQDALVRAGRLREESDYGWRVPKMADRWGEPERRVDQVVRAERSHPQPLPIQKLKRTRLTSEWQETKRGGDDE